MAIRQFKVNNTDVSIGLVTLTAPGFMSPEDKLALDVLSQANFEGGSITEITVHIEELQDITDRLSDIDSSINSLESTVQELKSKLDKYPEMHTNDGNTYAIKDSSWEIVCGEDEVILVDSIS